MPSAHWHAGKNVDTVLETLQENLRQYRMVESSLLQRRARLMGKLPEISQALDAVQLLIRKGEAGEQVGYVIDACL